MGMPQLKLYNSLTNSLENFVPIDPNNVRMYVCGPTVYASPHIGNARPLIIFDVLFRLLKVLYGENVIYVRNITDVDDKINVRAKKLSVSIRELTDAILVDFHKNIEKLNILPVTYEPRVTDHITEILNFIQKLVDNGFAYQSHGHVLFRIKSMQQYGMLSKKNTDDMIAGSRVEIAPYKENPLDFVLWKPSEKDMPSWDSKFGNGRPGWHIECSAMSYKYLGETFDIHAGGQDLMFPHHENELAQNFGAFGCVMANYWIHNGMLLVDGQKMSKSLDNVINLDTVLQQWNGEIIRYVLLNSHYQKTLNWTVQAVQQAAASLNRLYRALEFEKTECNNECSFENPVLEALCMNLNTPLAVNCLHEIASEIYKSDNQNERNQLCKKLRNGANILGLLQKTPEQWFKKTNNTAQQISEDEIIAMIQSRNYAKLERNFARADEIRNYLAEKNIKIDDTPDGTKWYRMQ